MVRVHARAASPATPSTRARARCVPLLRSAHSKTLSRHPRRARSALSDFATQPPSRSRRSRPRCSASTGTRYAVTSTGRSRVVSTRASCPRPPRGHPRGRLFPMPLLAKTVHAPCVRAGRSRLRGCSHATSEARYGSETETETDDRIHDNTPLLGPRASWARSSSTRRAKRCARRRCATRAARRWRTRAAPSRGFRRWSLSWRRWRGTWCATGAQNDLRFLRVRSKDHEMMVHADLEFTLIVIQNPAAAE